MTGFPTLFYFCVFVSVRLSVCLLLLFAFFFLSSFLSFFFLLNKQKNSVTSIKWQKLPFSKSKSDLIILSSCASVQPIASIFISFPSSELDAAALSPSPLPIRPPRIFLKRLSDLFFSRCQKLQALCFFSSGKVPSPPAHPSVFRASALSRFSVSGPGREAVQPMDHSRTQLAVVLPRSRNCCSIRGISTMAEKKKIHDKQCPCWTALRVCSQLKVFCSISR